MLLGLLFHWNVDISWQGKGMCSQPNGYKNRSAQEHSKWSWFKKKIANIFIGLGPFLGTLHILTHLVPSIQWDKNYYLHFVMKVEKFIT